MIPMLAAKVKPHQLHLLEYPRYVAPKLDGIRCVSTGSMLLSKTMKPLPNQHAWNMFAIPQLAGLDGELIMGSPCAGNVFRRTCSAVTTIAGEPDLTFWVFDWHPGSGGFEKRLEIAHSLVKLGKRHRRNIELVQHRLVRSPAEFLEAELEYINTGYEGIVSRSIYGDYKYGRSTLRQGWLVKMKRMEDSECRILSCYPRAHNANEAVVQADGVKRRSSHKAGKTALDTLGKMLAEDVHTGVQFELGTGKMTAEEAKAMWELWKEHPGKVMALVAKYQFFPVGVKEKPRHPVWHDWRAQFDM
jgi:DNA ligase-1